MERGASRTAGGIAYALRRGGVKNINLRVRRDGTVAVSAPRRVALAEIDAFVAKRAQWIAGAQERQLARQSAEREAPKPDRQQALAYFTALCAGYWPEFAPLCQKGRPAVKVREMKSRWGSCNLRTNTLTFNTLLMHYPEPVRRYVAVHEFCHFAHADHSPAFWAEVARHMPDWKARRALLRQPPQGR